MKSFDYFDTLVTRLVAKPADVFRLVEEHLAASGFAKRRQSAELWARRAKLGREVTLNEIYARLDMPADICAKAFTEELRLEQELAVPIRYNLDLIAHDDIVISDTYLPTEVLSKTLELLHPGLNPKMVISSAVGVRKADGALWDRVLAEHSTLSSHVGDNLSSDIYQPQQHGLSTEHYTKSILNRYEHKLNDGTINGSITAGCCRAGRLSMHRYGDIEPLITLGDVFASVFAPALTGFIDWMLARCMELGIRRLFFLARDGQLLFRIACARIKALALDCEPIYLFGSRQSLHLPGYTDINSAKSWLLENTPILTLRDIAERGGLDPESFGIIAKSHGFEGLDRNIPPNDRARLFKLISDKRFVNLIAIESDSRWEAAFAYYRSVGLGEGKPVALIDVGWNGRMQASLRKILTKGGADNNIIRGFYFCLSRKVKISENDYLEGFAYDPDRDQSINQFDSYRAMIEAALEADHGTTLRFEYGETGVRAVIDKNIDAVPLQIINRQQDAVMAFVSALCKVESVIGRKVSISRDMVLANLLRFLQTPSHVEATAFAKRKRCEGQVERRAEALVQTVSFGPSLLQRMRLGFWPEGSIAHSGYRWLLPVFGWARKLRGLLRQYTSA